MSRALMQQKSATRCFFYSIGGSSPISAAPKTLCPGQQELTSGSIYLVGVDEKLKRVLEEVLRRNAGESEFHQAVRAEIGRAHVGTPVTNAHLVCRLLLDKNTTNKNTK